MNTHSLPDTMSEVMARDGDLLSPAILSTTLAVPVPPSMTLPAFQTYAYVRAGNPAQLKYVNQDAESVTLAGGDGSYWIAISSNVHAEIAGWIRSYGSHYLWRAAGSTPPADPPGGLVLAGVTVAGGVITAVNTSYNYPSTKVAYGSATGGLAFSSTLTWDGSTLKAVGTMDSHRFLVDDYAGDNAVAFYTSLQAAGGGNRWAIYAGGNAPALLSGTLQVNGVVGFGGAPVAGYSLYTYYQTSLAANVGIGMGAAALTATLDVNGSVRSRGYFSADIGATLSGTVTAGSINCTHLTATNNVQGYYVGAGGAPDGRFSLRSYGTSYFDGNVDIGSEAGQKLNVGGNAYISGVLGIGVAPSGAWNIETPSILGTTIRSNGTLTSEGHVQGNSTGTFNGSLRTYGNFTASLEAGFGREAAVGYSIATGGPVYVGTSLTAASAYVSGNLTSGTLNSGNSQLGLLGLGYAPVSGYWLRAGTAWIDSLYVGGGSDGANTFRCYGTAYFDGGVGTAGNMGIGFTAPPNYRLSVNGTMFVAGNVEAANLQVNGATLQHSITTNGNAGKPGGGSWENTTSWRHLKQAIAPLEGALATLMRLQGRTWHWADDQPALEALMPGRQVGFVLEEVEEALPWWVQPTLNHSKAYTERGFPAYVVEALKEIVRRVEALEEHG